VDEYRFTIVAAWQGGVEKNVLVDVEPPVDSGPAVAPSKEEVPRPSRHNIEALAVASPESLRAFVAEITASANAGASVYALCFEPRLGRLYAALGLNRPPKPGERVPLQM
jgi:hypothetical protein